MTLTHSITVGLQGNGSFTYPSNHYVKFGTFPSWFSFQGGGLMSGTGLVRYYFTPPTPAVTVIAFFIFNNAGGALVTTGSITITALAKESKFETFTDCCKRRLSLAWINPFGGWSSYIFTGIKTDKLTVEEGARYLADNFYRDSEISEAYESFEVSTGYIPKEHIDYTKSLRYSIQAWLYNDATGKWDIPVYLVRSSFSPVLYSSKTKMFEYSFEIIFKKINTHTQ
jgi:hypothetical protein